MALGSFRAERFRCLSAVELELHPKANLFVGPNASGKTSLLEAAFFLSRGRSFRSRRREALIAHGTNDFVVSAQALGLTGPIPLGVRATRGDTEWRVGGAAAAGIADLAEQFPAQVIDPEVHKLLEEGPGRRRRFLDWGVFHVEHAFLSNWRRYHLALRQRNAALKKDATDDDLVAWNVNWLRVARRWQHSAAATLSGSLPRSPESVARSWTSRSPSCISEAGIPIVRFLMPCRRP